jgi:hypothetical protein
MKRSFKIMLNIAFLLAFFAFIVPAIAQEPPHPPTTGHGNVGNQSPNGSAPIDGGLSILIALGTAYGFRRANKNVKTL